MNEFQIRFVFYFIAIGGCVLSMGIAMAWISIARGLLLKQ